MFLFPVMPPFFRRILEQTGKYPKEDSWGVSSVENRLYEKQANELGVFCLTNRSMVIFQILKKMVAKKPDLGAIGIAKAHRLQTSWRPVCNQQISWEPFFLFHL